MSDTAIVTSAPPLEPYVRGCGAKWIASSLQVSAGMRTKGKRKVSTTVSEFGAKVADILSEVFHGIYHLEWPALIRAQWSNDRYIRVTTHQHLSSWDYDYLTRLVVLCHDYCVRVQVVSAGPRCLAMEFSARHGREGDMSRRHPTIEDAIARVRGGR